MKKHEETWTRTRKNQNQKKMSSSDDYMVTMSSDEEPGEESGLVTIECLLNSQNGDHIRGCSRCSLEPHFSRYNGNFENFVRDRLKNIVVDEKILKRLHTFSKKKEALPIQHHYFFYEKFRLILLLLPTFMSYYDLRDRKKNTKRKTFAAFVLSRSRPNIPREILRTIIEQLDMPPNVFIKKLNIS